MSDYQVTLHDSKYEGDVTLFVHNYYIEPYQRGDWETEEIPASLEVEEASAIHEYEDEHGTLITQQLPQEEVDRLCFEHGGRIQDEIFANLSDIY